MGQTPKRDLVLVAVGKLIYEKKRINFPHGFLITNQAAQGLGFFLAMIKKTMACLLIFPASCFSVFDMGRILM